MGSLGNLSIRVDKLPKENFKKGKNFDKTGEVYCDITISISDETRYNNNIGLYIPQTKEEVAVKKKKEYIGNGRVFWTTGTITVAEKEEKPQDSLIKDEGLPF
jgi:hypothetical protein